MKLKVKIIIIFCSLSLILFLIFPPLYLVQVVKLKMSNPNSDAIEDFNKGEFRYIGVYGFAAYAPGVNHIDTSQKTIKYYMPYTTDAINGFSHRYLIGLSTEYAKQHNIKLTQLLSLSNKNLSNENATQDASHK